MDDAFTYTVHARESPLTRRGILSVASSLYDPLGLLAPLTLIPKLVIQDLCRQKYKWDENIPDFHVQNWRAWIALAELKIPRWLGIGTNNYAAELQMLQR